MIDRPQDLSLPSMLVGSLAIVPAMVAVSVLVIMTATTQTAQARVTRIVVNERISPAFNGRSFGTVGQYEQINGIAYGEVDPQDPQNVIIQDIGLAPRNRDYPMLKRQSNNNKCSRLFYMVYAFNKLNLK